jgi:hypothetical protein
MHFHFTGPDKIHLADWVLRFLPHGVKRFAPVMLSRQNHHSLRYSWRDGES